ncbi:SDR family oxidoreductase [Dictyobacter aurantiacus]|uniref:Short chain dehydrogenase n=1 Tax=Dictyobacter aurantiacus TaxID=1936993 RepID=A0A401ZBH2_9CHLR|nr:SDR family oxidoreductase [Dictyobacter aurantiacus]GCE04103.1 short chain dehydrogenase [Dictyobacter aurantiacus]
MEEATQTKTALVTGGSRGIGAETVLALAARGYDVSFNYRNKAARAKDVVSQANRCGVQALAVSCDITRPEDRARLFAEVRQWRSGLDVLVLNASGGLEKEALALDPDYPMHINRDAQVAMVDLALPQLRPGGAIVFITSHWAHLYGHGIQHVPSYEPVAASKYAGEQALRARQQEFAARGIRFVVVTGDLIEGTITPKLLERSAPGLAANRSNQVGALPTAAEMGEAIARAATDAAIPDGRTIVIGGSLESLLPEGIAL